MKIPNTLNPIFVQKNNGERDINANIAGTWNCDFSRYPNKVCASSRLVVRTTSSEQANICTSPIFAYFKDNTSRKNFWAINNSKPTIATQGGTFIDNTYTNVPSPEIAYSDYAVTDDYLYLSLKNNVARLAKGATVWAPTWFTGLGGALSSTPHPMEFLAGKNELMIADGKSIHIYITGGALSGTLQSNYLTLPYNVNMIRAGLSKAYIFTGGEGGQDTIVFEWDGGDTQPTRSYPIKASGVLSSVIKDNVLYVLTTKMEIQALSGSGFITLAQFPIARSDYSIQYYENAFSQVCVSQRGMMVQKDAILINICSQTNASTATKQKYLEYYPSGIWEFNTKTNSLSHKHAPTYPSSIGTISDVGQWVTALGNGGVSDTAYAGGIMPFYHDTGTYTLFASAPIYKTNSTVGYGIYVDDRTKENRARITTNTVFKDDVQTSFNTVALKYQPMLSTSDSIVVKYRIQTKEPIPMEVTFSNSTTFTTSDDISTASIGDEVFILNGKGGGESGQIKSIVSEGGIYTVILDETLTVQAGDAITAVVQNWRRLISFNDMLGTGKEFSVPVQNSSWIQYMIELRATQAKSVVLEEIDITGDKVI